MQTPCTLLPPSVSVTSGQVEVWYAPLDIPPSEVHRLERTLANDEVSRAARFRHLTDRRHFVACRGILREILSRYVDESPGEIEFCYGPRGKPRLRSDDGPHRLRFNVSHSQGLAVFAIAHDREVGVDIERLDPNLEWQEIAESVFSAEEVNALRSLPAQSRSAAFLNVWTRKEAYAKARGEGLSLPLGELETLHSPDDSRSFFPSGNCVESSRWTLRAFTPTDGYVGALAVEGTGSQITCERWRE